jgi:hypothetical protein
MSGGHGYGSYFTKEKKSSQKGSSKFKVKEDYTISCSYVEIAMDGLDSRG